MIILKFKPKSPEWLETRRKYVTATEVSSLFGLDKYKSANKVLQDKLNPPEFKDNLAMRAGRILELGVFIAMGEVGLPATPVDHDHVVMGIDEDSGLACSLDGKMELDGGFHLVECKTTRIDLFEKWISQPPLKYLLQVQTQLAVMNKTSSLLACLGTKFPELPLIVYQVESNQTIQDLLREESKRFWRLHKEDVKYKFNNDYKTLIENEITKGINLIYLDPFYN